MFQLNVNEFCRAQLQTHFGDMNEKVLKAKLDNLNWWHRLIIYMISLLVREFPYLHKMDNLCVDFKRKTVKYEIDQKRFHILRTRSGKAGHYTLEEETLKKLSDIVAKKQLLEESVNEKVDSLQAEVESLKTSIKVQHEELKALIQECLVKS